MFERRNGNVDDGQPEPHVQRVHLRQAADRQRADVPVGAASQQPELLFAQRRLLVKQQTVDCCPGAMGLPRSFPNHRGQFRQQRACVLGEGMADLGRTRVAHDGAGLQGICLLFLPFLFFVLMAYPR